MREVETSSRFRKDYKREKKNPNNPNLNALLGKVIHLLRQDIQLDATWRDHPLGGNYSGFRSCHVKPDLVLIYEKNGSNLLRLVRIGTHSELY